MRNSASARDSASKRDPASGVAERRRGPSFLKGALFPFIASPLAIACLSPASEDEPTEGDAPSWAASGGSDSGNASGGGSTIMVPPQGTGGEMTKCDSSPEVDQDGDGFTGASGDCNDCNANTNPGAFDLPDNGVDEDCDGLPDNSTMDCDDGLPVEGMDARDAARALGICRDQEGESWGLVEAKWVYPDGTELSTDGSPSYCDSLEVGVPPAPESHGILENFGPNVSPLQGKRLVALSTGVARVGVNQLTNGTTSPSGGQQCTVSKTPSGFPKDAPSCAPVTTANDTVARDAVALELTIKAPTNATQFSFGLDFYTFEFPTYVCSKYNDFFVALLESQHEMIPGDLNISFDAQGNPISVNNALVEVCKGPVEAGDLNKPFECSLGTKELMGTGFDMNSDSGTLHAAATGWLTTAAPIVPGEVITLRFAIWDTGDEILDSTILLDDFKWSAEPGSPDGPKTVRPH